MTGVESAPTKPTMSPAMQNVVSLLTFVANSIVAAGKCRQERLAGELKPPATLDDVMKKSGLEIPGIREALAQLMGGSEEAKRAAALMVNTPDPANLLRLFAEQCGFGVPANSGPIVTPPPRPSSRPTPLPEAAAPPSRTSSLPRFRPDFTREAREAAKGAARPPEASLPKFRPEFTREAREATKAMAADPQAPRTSLGNVVEHQLGALRSRVAAHRAELDLRLKRAEAELVALRQELHELRAAGPTPVQVEGAPVKAEASPLMADEPAGPVEPPRDVAGAFVTSSDELAELSGPEAVEELQVGRPLPLAASEQEVAHAIGLIGEFAEELGTHHTQDLERVVTIEHEISVMRAQLQLERRAAGASAHG